MPNDERPSAALRAIELEYETFGDPKAPPLLLIMGLGAQMIAWEDDFCKRLAGRGRFVIRYDNRDVGRSTRLHGQRTPPLGDLLARAAAGESVDDVPYLLRDLAADAIGLLDSLSLGSAHVVGLSMGGMIAQEMAIRWPRRLRSLTSIMSTTSAPDLAGPLNPALLTPMPKERGAYIETAVNTLAQLAGSRYPLDRERAQHRVALAYDRSGGPYAAGFLRQFVAILSSGSRQQALRQVRVPTLVIHGTEDPLIPARAGQATAAAIPGARYLEIPGMGHDLPEPVWPLIIDALIDHSAESPN